MEYIERERGGERGEKEGRRKKTAGVFDGVGDITMRPQ